MQIALYIGGAVALILGLAGLLVYAALREMDAIDRESEDEPTEHGGRPL